MLKRILKAILLAILINLFLAGLITGGYNYYQNQKANRLAIKGLQSQINEIQKDYNNLIGNDIELVKIIQELKNKIQIEPDIEKLLRSNVFVRGAFNGGAGTVIKKTEKYMYILTCNHVVEDIIEINKQGYKLTATIGYSKTDEYNKIAGMIAYKAEIIKYDEERDLALLKIFVLDDNLEAVSIAEKEPQLGDTVYSIGSPLGLLRTISKGILSHHEEGFNFSDNTTTYGNSGGGLYNLKGELIGVPSNVYVYGNDRGEYTAPESSLGMSRDLRTIKEFLTGVEYK